MRRGISAWVIAAACLCAPATAHAQEFIYDPFENFNRHLLAVHEAIDHAVLAPVARGYRHITPRPVRNSVNNFLDNLHSPVVFVNDVLQGEAKRAGTTAARFGINSTIGVLGIFDPARNMGFAHHDEDFGQTLAVWGVSSGPYLFIPVLGPTTVRDGAGQIVDLVFDPLNWARFHDANAVRTTRVVVTGVAARESVLDEVDDIYRNSGDPYVTIRTSYGLFRYSAIQNGRRDVQSLPDFEAIPGDGTPETPAPEGPGQPEQQQPQAQPSESAPAAPQPQQMIAPSADADAATRSLISTGATQ